MCGIIADKNTGATTGVAGGLLAVARAGIKVELAAATAEEQTDRVGVLVRREVVVRGGRRGTAEDLDVITDDGSVDGTVNGSVLLWLIG